MFKSQQNLENSGYNSNLPTSLSSSTQLDTSKTNMSLSSFFSSNKKLDHSFSSSQHSASSTLPRSNAYAANHDPNSLNSIENVTGKSLLTHAPLHQVGTDLSNIKETSSPENAHVNGNLMSGNNDNQNSSSNNNSQSVKKKSKKARLHLFNFKKFRNKDKDKTKSSSSITSNSTINSSSSLPVTTFMRSNSEQVEQNVLLSQNQSDLINSVNLNQLPGNLENLKIDSIHSKQNSNISDKSSKLRAFP